MEVSPSTGIMWIEAHDKRSGFYEKKWAVAVPDTRAFSSG